MSFCNTLINRGLSLKACKIMNYHEINKKHCRSPSSQNVSKKFYPFSYAELSAGKWPWRVKVAWNAEIEGGQSKFLFFLSDFFFLQNLYYLCTRFEESYSVLGWHLIKGVKGNQVKVLNSARYCKFLYVKPKRPLSLWMGRPVSRNKSGNLPRLCLLPYLFREQDRMCIYGNSNDSKTIDRL